MPPAAYSRPVTCLRCGYDLAGLAPSGVCPECGTPLRRSLHRPWHEISAKRARVLRIAMVLLLVSVSVNSLAAIYVCSGAGTLAGAGWEGPLRALWICGLYLWPGGWYLSTWGPTRDGDRAMVWTLRLFAAVFALTAAALIGLALSSQLAGLVGVVLAAGVAGSWMVGLLWISDLAYLLSAGWVQRVAAQTVITLPAGVLVLSALALLPFGLLGATAIVMAATVWLVCALMLIDLIGRLSRVARGDLMPT